MKSGVTTIDQPKTSSREIGSGEANIKEKRVAKGQVSVRAASAEEIRTWDELVSSFENYRIFHKLAWLKMLEATSNAELLYLVLEKKNLEKEERIVGCLPGFLMKKGVFGFFGSPLPGSQTLSIGPVFDPGQVTTGEIFGALVPFLEKQYQVHYIELASSQLDPESMQESGFEGNPILTQRAVLLPGQEEAMFKALDKSARRNIRRGARLGLVVKFEEEDGFVDEVYDQLKEVYARNNASMPFSKKRALECFRNTRESGNLVAVSVSLPDTGVIIATGMFVIEGKELIMWAWTTRAQYRWYCPTELMTWTVMQKAMEAGCTVFDMGGGGEFKEKFATRPDTSVFRWERSRYSWLSTARDLAERGYRWQQGVRGSLARNRQEKLLNNRVDAEAGKAPAGSSEEEPIEAEPGVKAGNEGRME